VVLKDKQRQAYGGGGTGPLQSQSCKEDEEKEEDAGGWGKCRNEASLVFVSDFTFCPLPRTVY